MGAPFGSGYSFVPANGVSAAGGAPSTGIAGQLDLLIDPVTLDYVRTANGEWTEVPDSRSTMLLMLELHLGASPFDPGDGTTIAELRESGAPLTPEDVRAETLRAGGILQSDGVISGLAVIVRDQSGETLSDQAGRLLVQTSWRDLASGSPIDQIFSPG